jgi:hypothetical protein
MEPWSGASKRACTAAERSIERRKSDDKNNANKVRINRITYQIQSQSGLLYMLAPLHLTKYPTVTVNCFIFAAREREHTDWRPAGEHA